MPTEWILIGGAGDATCSERDLGWPEKSYLGGKGGKGIRYVSSRILIPGRSEGLDMIDVVSIGVESIPFVKIGI